MKVVNFENDPALIKEFITLPKMLYKKKYLTQNEKEETDLLEGNHILSKYFSVKGFLVYADHQVVARGLVTLYEKDHNAYFGYFESIDDETVSGTLFSAMENYAQSQNRNSMVGPVNCSFWISYRLKLNRFNETPYVSEMYNKPYYGRLIEKAGFKVSEGYASNQYEKPGLKGYKVKKFINRYEDFIKKGYKFISPNKGEFDQAIRGIYKLIMQLYTEFPLFKSIDENSFLSLNAHYKLILNYKFVKLAYHNDELVGFCIAVPNYNTLLYGRLTLIKKIKFLLKKIRASNYILLYMGVLPEHKGLGTAITQSIIRETNKKRASVTSAFIKLGRITEGYATPLIDSTYHYYLFEKNIK